MWYGTGLLRTLLLGHICLAVQSVIGSCWAVCSFYVPSMPPWSTASGARKRRGDDHSALPYGRSADHADVNKIAQSIQLTDVTTLASRFAIAGGGG
jgi:hypothetical protein